MKYITPRILQLAGCISLVLGSAPLCCAQTQAPTAAPAAPAPALTVDQASYLFGLTFGTQMHTVGISSEINMEAVSRGMKDGLQGKQASRADMQQLSQYAHAVMEGAATRNQAAAKTFLAKNTHEKGVVTTASGLQYKIIAPGDANPPTIKPTDEVTVNYSGKLLDGSEFDNTWTRNMPVTFAVNGVIPGWQEALVLMKPNAHWQLFVPPELGYGGNPKPGIPGGSLLLFDVQVLSVKPAGSAPSAAPVSK
jgi:FKBP-type peptidyl-prolyl cis-trans isomerase